MNNQEIFIIVIIVILIIMKFANWAERFENTYPCQTHPNNSNCSCPPNVPNQRVLGQFPMNYGLDSPYRYTCVPDSAKEPSTNDWPSM